MGQPSESRPLTVRALNLAAKDLLESRFATVRVQGELSRVTIAPSGHVYFALKDADSRIDAVIWAASARQVRFPLTEGLAVVIRGQLTIFAPQGRYQLVAHSIEPAGDGALRAAFLKLKARLDEEGLTNPDRKRPLPFLPRAVGVLTSPVGAALHDILQVVWRRFPNMRVVHAPARVQGEGAEAELMAGLGLLNECRDVDVVIVGRGGGSREDLWTFNHEGLVRAIAASRLPVISAVGHEIDVTLADLVADRRALTPTEAGELAVPVAADLERDLGQLAARLTLAQVRRLKTLRHELEGLSRRPGLRAFPARFEEERESLDLLWMRAVAALRKHVQERRQRMAWLGRTLDLTAPTQWVKERKAALLALQARSERAVRQDLSGRRRALLPLLRALEALNPLAVLARGFAVAWLETPAGPRLLRGAAEAPEGAELRLRWAEGPDLRAVSAGVAPADATAKKGANFGGQGESSGGPVPASPPPNA